MTSQDFRHQLEGHARFMLVNEPTPVRRLDRAFPSGHVWLKDDARTNDTYGGNKPRKLEYLVAKAKERRQSVLTFGYESSNHAVASVLHCHAAGVPCHLVLVRGPECLSEADSAAKCGKLAVVRKLAASVEVVESYAQGVRVGMRKWISGLGKIRLIPPGGSNALGTLGYVRAALELAGQVERGELPEPETVFVPLGTGGTAVGISIGLTVSGLHSRVIAVKVVPGPVNELARLRWLARQVKSQLPGLSREATRLSNLEIDRSALGEGYGAPTPAALAAVERWRSEEGIELESTYSGKTAAAFESYLARRVTNGAALFWLTYSALPLR